MSLWHWFRRRKPKPVGIVPVHDEAAADMCLKPWSASRGFYSFPAVDFPLAYFELSNVQEGATFKQFGEDEADALQKLQFSLDRRAVDERLVRTLPRLAVKSVAFKPLTKRKRDRTP